MFGFFLASGQSWDSTALTKVRFSPQVHAARKLVSKNAHRDLAVAVPVNIRFAMRCVSWARLVYMNNSSASPSLSENDSRLTPALFSSVRCKFASGVCFSYVMWRPPFMFPAAPPATITGKSVWSCASGSPMPLPYMYKEWSSSEPFPSGVAAIFSRNSANSDTWNWLIFATLASLAGLFPWCDSGWCGSGTPISG